ncbi:uncharacterized protein LOC100843213 isoform X1 [Brachypodium distachyon]|uniref:Uncharacterized protein n=2 Tax=Brachypodium distachyon TaxID=15368 RepID=I1GRU8_BRADI|nr:uncharacterized protein LOC100843213 isoform X1 [Brachypodium distachyon]KQK14976.1 hypothetical protein BRADI_1g19890v3 [Brachypodium distachyon]|eukprot:XP_003559897.1 uncharacterized protein LOC100843213 isoform X1 [Brachypodium distachyon]
MAIPYRITGGSRGGHSPLPLPTARALLAAVTTGAVLSILCVLSFTDSLSYLGFQPGAVGDKRESSRKYLYWGPRVDCPGKHCASSCAGLGHQESSLRCALEEALFLDRIFVMPSKMCLSSVHNTKGILDSSNATSDSRWERSSCAIESLYDIDLISKTVPVVLDNPRSWYGIVSRSTKLGEGDVAHVQGVSRAELKENPLYSAALLINRTASPLAWFMECKDRNKRSSVMLPYTFLPTMPARKLRDAVNKMKEILGDYDAIHVRRGDLLKNRKDRFGVERSLHPHLDRDTRPEFIKKRIARWIPKGRTLFIASNERTLGFFSPLSDRYKLAYSSNFTSILEPIIENNYQLFMVERLIMQGAKTFVKTMKEFDNDLALCDDPKKNTKVWEEPVYTGG